MVAGCRNAGLLVWDCCPSRTEEARSSDPDASSESWAPSSNSSSAAAPCSLPTRHGRSVWSRRTRVAGTGAPGVETAPVLL